MKKTTTTFSVIRQIILSLVFVCFLSSCFPTKLLIQRGQIVTPGVEIRGQDGSFVLKYGDFWTPPFSNDDINYKGQDKWDFNSEDMVSKYKTALQAGGQKVRIKVPYLEKELYGVLMFLPYNAIRGCDSPVKRSYQISIPKNYVEMALNGRVSVVYEYYKCKSWYGSFKTWILWMSDVPF